MDPGISRRGLLAGASCAAVAFVTPEDGMFMFEQSSNLLKFGTQKAEAPIGVNDIPKILKWDWNAANAQRDSVTERWNRVMR